MVAGPYPVLGAKAPLRRPETSGVVSVPTPTAPRKRARTVKGPALNKLLGKPYPRQWICYHNASEWGFDIHTPNPVFTGKRLKVDSLMGDKVWTVARRSDNRKYYLIGFFIISRVTVRPQTKQSRAGLTLDGSWARVFTRPVPLARELWFHSYVHEKQGLSHGLQRIKGRSILGALESLAFRRSTEAVAHH